MIESRKITEPSHGVADTEPVENRRPLVDRAGSGAGQDEGRRLPQFPSCEVGRLEETHVVLVRPSVGRVDQEVFWEPVARPNLVQLTGLELQFPVKGCGRRLGDDVDPGPGERIVAKHLLTAVARDRDHGVSALHRRAVPVVAPLQFLRRKQIRKGLMLQIWDGDDRGDGAVHRFERHQRAEPDIESGQDRWIEVIELLVAPAVDRDPRIVEGRCAVTGAEKNEFNRGVDGGQPSYEFTNIVFVAPDLARPKTAEVDPDSHRRRPINRWRRLTTDRGRESSLSVRAPSRRESSSAWSSFRTFSDQSRSCWIRFRSVSPSTRAFKNG